MENVRALLISSARGDVGAGYAADAGGMVSTA